MEEEGQHGRDEGVERVEGFQGRDGGRVDRELVGGEGEREERVRGGGGGG